MSEAQPSSPAASEGGAGVEVRDLRPLDLPFAADLHESALPHGFFAQLGRRFLRSYYRTFVASPYGIAILAEVDDQPAGVLVGTSDNDIHWRWTARTHGFRLAVLGALALTARPRLVWRFLRTRIGRYVRALVRSLTHYRARSAADPATSSSRRVAVLTHVSVTVSARGRGVGGRLVDEFLQRASKAGANEARLVTLVGDGSSGSFYRRLGWEHTGDRSGRDGAAVSEFRYRLDPGSGGS